MRKKKEERRRNLTISDFSAVCKFLNSCVLKGTFVSVFMNCKAVSFSLHTCFGVCSFFGHYPVIHNYGKFKISVAIPK